MYSEMSVADFETYLTMLGNDVLIAGEQYDIIVIGGYAIIKYYSSKYRTMTRDIDFGYMDYRGLREDSFFSGSGRFAPHIGT